MANQGSDVLALIGAMQTLVANFPMGILSSLNVKKYSSSLEFLMDALSTIGITDTDLLNYIIKDVLGVDDISTITIDDNKEYQKSEFIASLEKSLKFLIAEILANIIGCSVWPKVPNSAIDEGIIIPKSLLDPANVLNTCPTSSNGKYLYAGITNDMTPADLSGATDLNAFIWHSVNLADPLTGETWSGNTKSAPICNITTRGFNGVRIKVDESFRGKTLFSFNKAYLNSIDILSPKIILMNILNEYMNGLPNVQVDLGFTDSYIEAVIDKVIDTIIINNDTEVDDCYYTFSNEDYNNLLEDTELKKYNAKKVSDDSNEVATIDKDTIMEKLNTASSAATLYDRAEGVSDIFSDTTAITRERDVLVSEGTTERDINLSFDYNKSWIRNILLTIVRPIMKSILTPQVMGLIMVNYEIAGAVNLSTLNNTNVAAWILNFIKTRLMLILVAIVKLVANMIIKFITKYFTIKITPLVIKYNAAKILEAAQYYIQLLEQALECIKLWKWWGTNGQTAIDEVNYADIDITQNKNKPNQSIC